MPKILSFGNLNPKQLRENPLKAIWEWFSSLEIFTKLFIITVILLLILTPFIVNNLFTIFQKASEVDGEAELLTTEVKEEFVKGELLIKFKKDAPQGLQESILKGNNASLIREFPEIGVKHISVPEKAEDKVIEALSKNPQIEYVEKNSLGVAAETIPNDPKFVKQQSNGIGKTKVTYAWDKSKGNSGIIIAILDTGIDSDHPDLKNKIIQGYNVVDNNFNLSDHSGHGTSVAGLAASSTNNSAGVSGLCWMCSIMPVKVISPSGYVSWSDLIEGIIWATNNGAKVINMSLYGPTGHSSLRDAVIYAHNKGIVLFAAAGNEGNSSERWPAAYPEVVGVAASNAKDNIFSWSNYGSWVSIAAPGQVLTTAASLTGYKYWTFKGTSAATPVAAGIAALAFELNPNLTSAQVEKAIYSTTDGIGSKVFYGRINANKMLNYVSSQFP